MAQRATGKRVSPRSGLVKVTVSLRPEQLAQLMEEATRRALAAGASRLDLSNVVREALDLWRSWTESHTKAAGAPSAKARRPR